MDFNTFKTKNEKNINMLSDYQEDKRAYAYIANFYFDNGSEESSIDEENIIIDENIDFIWTDTNQENNIIFVKLCSREDILHNCENIVNKMKDGKKDTYKDAITNVLENVLEDEGNINYRYILINKDDKEISNKKSIINDFNDDVSKHKNEFLEIIELNDINKRIAINNRKELYIKEGEFDIDDKDNCLYYKSKNELVSDAIVCNISAKSLKNNWDEFGNNLLNLNLRFFKKQKSIDKDIENSIKDGKNFWFLNNGLYIICDSFKFLNNKIRLTNFSIINGEQTTYNISHQTLKVIFI